MYNQLTVYYLRQIGLTPWITRAGNVNQYDANQSTVLDTHQLIFVVPDDLSEQAAFLLERMRLFSNTHIPSQVIYLSDLDTEFKIVQGTVYLLLGIFEQGSNTFKSTHSFIQSVSLNQVIRNPIDKKRLYADWLKAQEFLNNRSIS